MPTSGSNLKVVVPIVSALLYGASPIDLIPDLIPLIGWVDDGVIMTLLIILAGLQMKRRQAQARVMVPVQNRR